MSWLITGSEKTPVDPQFGSVSLLLHGDGANGSTTIVDSSPSPKTVTAFGNAQISTAQSRFGGASILFDGNGDHLSLNPTAPELMLGLGNFTIESWIRMVAFSTSANETYFPIIHRGAAYFNTTGFVQAYVFRYSPQEGNRLIFNHRPSSAGFTEGTHTFTKRSTVLNLNLNTWYHVAAVRNGNILSLYLDGQDVTDSSFGNYSWSTFDLSLNGSPNYFNIGRMRGGADNVFWDANGYIDDLRITKGVARYTANFTPPTAPFPDI